MGVFSRSHFDFRPFDSENHKFVGYPMLLTETQIALLLKQLAISDEWPWATNDEAVIDKNIKDIVAEIRRKLRLEDKTEYGHYGSGYASFVDCWLYRPDAEFRYRAGDNYHGLVVLFSRLSPFYVFGQGDKSWDKIGGRIVSTRL